MQRPDHGQPVRPGEHRLGGVVLGDLRLDGGAVRHVGRVRGDQVGAALQVGQQARVQDVAAAQLDPACRRRSTCAATLRRAQASADGERSTPITRGVRPGGGDGQRDGARCPVHRSTTTGAVTPAMALQRPLDQRLGLRPRDEHAGTDLHRGAAELHRADQVLQRDPLRALGYQRSVGSTQSSSTSGVRPSRVRGTPSRCAASSCGVDAGLGTPARSRVRGRRQDGGPQRLPGHARPAAAAPSRSARSAACSASSTASRSPSSTASRL